MLKIFIGLFFIFSSSAFASATTGSVDAATSLEKILANIQTLQANFSETISSGHHVNQRLFGTFLLKKPGKFFWQTKRPIHQDIISDGKHLWIYDKDLEQILIKSLEKNVGTTPVLLLNGQINAKEGAILKDYQVKMGTSNNGNRLYTLIPKQKLLYHYIQMSFNGNVLTHMRFEDNLGQFTDFTFTQVKLNKPMSNLPFVFTPPTGIDVINE